jgi:hypothetical protein
MGVPAECEGAPDTLNITVGRQRDGKPVSTEFKYSRIKP